jgi:hypothetical protein
MGVYLGSQVDTIVIGHSGRFKVGRQAAYNQRAAALLQM